ncbi:MAG: cupin domain-containing protein [Kofleriaceae bacterium]|nr:cupin domain-containing protein [Kofleriaceae bacterium]MCL4226118.1 cupin domain-containing protein [Myxococcales bacterium]
MREGEVVTPSPGEKITCIRSGQAGGPFIFELELAPGKGGPPTHTHDEGDETIEVLEGRITFVVNGRKRTLAAGERVTLTPEDAHTFYNPSKTETLRAKVIHGARFERAVDQPSLRAVLVYLAYVDPGASRATNPLMGAFVRVVAWFARLAGTRPNVAGKVST